MWRDFQICIRVPFKAVFAHANQGKADALKQMHLTRYVDRLIQCIALQMIYGFHFST